MNKKDYYETLGVNKDATAQEIKSAFRKLAKKYHPDNKETGDEAKFKEIGEAYAVLSDENKRRQYDQFGSAAFDGSAGYGGFDPGDIDLNDILTNELKQIVLKVVKDINKQYSIHDFRIVTGPTHTNLIFDVLIPSNDQIKHDLLKEQINEKLQNINPNYQTVMQIEHSFV